MVSVITTTVQVLLVCTALVLPAHALVRLSTDVQPATVLRSDVSELTGKESVKVIPQTSAVMCPAEGPCFEGIAAVSNQLITKGTDHHCTYTPSTTGPVACWFGAKFAGGSPSTPLKSDSYCANAWIAQALNAHNVLRQNVGLGPLQCVEEACAAAAAWSYDMCQRGSIGHEHFQQNCAASGFGGSCAENVLYNYDTGDDAGQKATEQWQHSQGHYANIVNANYNRVGLGYVVCGQRAFWTGVFGG